MMRTVRLLAASVLLGIAVAPAPHALAASAAPATGETLVLDRSHSYVGFQVRHFLSRVPGKFNTFTGSVTWDPKSLASLQLAADIDAASIDTDHEKRDNHLRSADFFDVANNPKITFKSTAVKAVDATHAQVTGDLTMRGVTKPVTLDVEFLGEIAGRAGFEARGKVNRKDFGINWNRTLDNGSFLLSDDVDLVIQVEAMKPAPPEPAKPTAPAASNSPAKG